MVKMNIILLGESGVGKTSLLLRFKTGEFPPPGSPAQTLSVESHTKVIEFEGREVTLHLWDTAGTERFNSISSNYFRQADGVLLLYDVTDMNSFFKLSNWVGYMKELNEDAPILIVGNKNEDPGRKAVNVSVVHSFANGDNLDNMEMSVMTGDNVQEAFDRLVRKVIVSRGFSYLSGRREDVVLLEDSSNQTQNKSCCFLSLF